LRAGLAQRARIVLLADEGVRGAGGRDRQGHRRLLPATPARGVSALPQTRRQDLPAAAAAHRGRQLRHPQTPDRGRLLANNTRITLHFTPTSGSWLNMVEIFFGIITRQAIRPGTFTSVKDLIAAIENYIDAWNERCQPFFWTKTADDILTNGTGGQRSSFTRH
jgi:hypothetical protein